MNAKTTPETGSFDAAELGAMMREMRENLGHDLETVASDLRIRLVYLEAIESGRLNDLPGNAYVSGFLRSYSDFLGLEGDEIVRRFKMAGAAISSQPQLHLPSPVEEGRLPTGSILVVAAVIAAAAYGGWYYLSSAGNDPMETVASLPKELSGLVDGAKNQTAATDTTSSSPNSSPAASPAPSVPSPVEQVTAPETPETSSPETPSTGASTPETAVASVTSETPAITPSAVPAPSPVPAAESAGGNNGAESTAAPAADAATSPVSAPATAAVRPASQPEPVQRVVTPAPETPVQAEQTQPGRPAARAAAETPAQIAPTPAVGTPALSPAAAETPAGPVSAAAVSPPSRDATPPATSASSSSPSLAASLPATAEPARGGVRIIVRATADSYVAVRTGENEPLFSQLMRPGDSYEVPSGADLVLETGNAGGLQITVGGKRAPSLGPIGQIRRNIPLDAEKLLRGLN